MIQLTSIQISELGSDPIWLFASHEEALAHLCDHVLTSPESDFWSVLMPELRDIANPAQDRELQDLAMAFWNNERTDEAQQIYGSYADEIKLAICVARMENWQWDKSTGGKTRHFGIGTNGVLVVWRDQVVVSAMLEPYAATKSRIPISYNDRKQNPRPRQKSRAKNDCELADLPLVAEKTRYDLF